MLLRAGSRNFKQETPPRPGQIEVSAAMDNPNKEQSHQGASAQPPKQKAWDRTKPVPRDLAHVAMIVRSVRTETRQPAEPSTPKMVLERRLPDEFLKRYTDDMLEAAKRDRRYLAAQAVMAAGQGRAGHISFIRFDLPIDWLERTRPTCNCVAGLALHPAVEISQIEEFLKSGNDVMARKLAKRRILFDLAGIVEQNAGNDPDRWLHALGDHWVGFDYTQMYNSPEVMPVNEYPLPCYPDPFGSAFSICRLVEVPEHENLITDKLGYQLMLDACRPGVQFFQDHGVKEIVWLLATIIEGEEVLPGKFVREIIDHEAGGLAYVEDVYRRTGGA